MGRKGNTLRTWAVALAAIIAVVALSAPALADATLLKEDFKGADGAKVSSDRWRTIGLDPSDSASIEGEALELQGNVSLEARDSLALHDFEVLVNVSVLNGSGRSAMVGLISVHGGRDEAAHIAVWYEGAQGWVVKTTHKGGEVLHVENATATIGGWYTVSLRIERSELAVNVTPMGNGTGAWHHETEFDAFTHEARLELTVEGSQARFDTVRIVSYGWQDNPVSSVAIGLFVVLFVVLLGPFMVKKIEHQLEAFLFTMGVIAVSLDTVLLKLAPPAGGGGHSLDPVWSLPLVEAGLFDPLKITAAVLIAGFAFHFFRNRFKQMMTRAIDRLSLPAIVFVTVVVLGLVASMITAIISALLLVEIISVLKFDRKTEADLTILACFSIGLGAALTPIGEPLSTIVIDTKLNEEFWYLAKLIGIYIVPAIVALGIVGVFYLRRGHVSRQTLEEEHKEEKLQEVGIRAGKVYLFVMALVFLGTGFAPIIEWYIKKLGWGILYWVNTSSAILDNATLASAEIVPTMSEFQIIAALMALLIAGGMLIPGNIPNIISANKLKITSKEWARFGVPVGVVLLAVFFVLLLLQA
jgi:predicted cation transporter